MRGISERRAFMNGLLRDHPFAELIREISDERFSGALHLSRARVKGVIYFDVGQIVYARLNLRTQRLAALLRHWKVLDVERLAKVLTEGMTDEEAAAALVAAGLVTDDELGQLQARQGAEALRPLLLWTEGTWDFNPRAQLTGEPRMTLDVREILMESARRLPAEFVATRLRNDREMISLVPQLSSAQMSMTTAEAFVLSRLGTGAPLLLGELIAISGLSETDARQAIYALTLGALLERHPAPRALPADEVARAAPTVRAPSSTTVTKAAGDNEKAPAAIVAPSAPVIDLRAEMAALFEREAAANHYHLMGVGRQASAPEIKRAYYALAKRFHPDRFHHEADERLQARVEQAFAKIAQAYEVLKDSKLRAAYDVTLETMSRAPAGRAGANISAASASTSQRAEESFQQGLQAFEQGEMALALKHLTDAARLAPKQPRYRAYYGRVLAHDPRTRRHAEIELQAAIALDANNVSYRIMLAELYLTIGLRRRAEGELQRALRLDPQHAAAHSMLANLRSMEANT